MASIKVTKEDIKKYLEGQTIPDKYAGKFETEVDYLRYLLGESLKTIENAQKDLKVREELMENRLKEANIKKGLRDAIIYYNKFLKAIAPTYNIDKFKLMRLIGDAGMKIDEYLELNK